MKMGTAFRRQTISKNDICYLSGQELSFDWTENELIKVDEMYHGNKGLGDMAQELNRPAIEILILLNEMIEKGITEISDVKMFGELKRGAYV